ncbi:hypothetical protein V8F06_000829 [Rhypophila decipiens]
MTRHLFNTYLLYIPISVAIGPGHFYLLGLNDQTGLAPLTVEDTRSLWDSSLCASGSAALRQKERNKRINYHFAVTFWSLLGHSKPRLGGFTRGSRTRHQRHVGRSLRGGTLSTKLNPTLAEGPRPLLSSGRSFLFAWFNTGVVNKGRHWCRNKTTATAGEGQVRPAPWNPPAGGLASHCTHWHTASSSLPRHHEHERAALSDHLFACCRLLASSVSPKSRRNRHSERTRSAIIGLPIDCRASPTQPQDVAYQ